mmetsp:Transcript_16963/g.45684  ORF Transcript_16963/g.45684 Transcript_16963/m.45684 type:complete len:226 (-) Transcript_16963:493-1170(-)
MPTRERFASRSAACTTFVKSRRSPLVGSGETSRVPASEEEGEDCVQGPSTPCGPSAGHGDAPPKSRGVCGASSLTATSLLASSAASATSAAYDSKSSPAWASSSTKGRKASHLIPSASRLPSVRPPQAGMVPKLAEHPRRVGSAELPVSGKLGGRSRGGSACPVSRSPDGRATGEEPKGVYPSSGEIAGDAARSIAEARRCGEGAWGPVCCCCDTMVCTRRPRAS